MLPHFEERGEGVPKVELALAREQITDEDGLRWPGAHGPGLSLVVWLLGGGADPELLLDSLVPVAGVEDPLRLA